MYMESKKNKFCMQYCKPRYMSIADKNCKRFRSRMVIVLQTVLYAFLFLSGILCYFYKMVHRFAVILQVTLKKNRLTFQKVIRY